MKRVEQIFLCLIILLWGVVLLYFYQHEKLFIYLHPQFHVYVLLGGCAAVVLGSFNLLTLDSKGECGHGDECDHDHEHSGDINPLVGLLIVAAPIIFSMWVTTHGVSAEHEAALSEGDPDPSSIRLREKSELELSMENAERSQGGHLTQEELIDVVRKSLEQNSTKSADGAYQLSLLELFFSAGDEIQEKVLDGSLVETEGKIREEINRNPKGNRMRLYRVFMTCCASDMQAIPISIEFDGELPDIESQQWVKVVGKLTYEHIDGVSYPVIKVKSIIRILPPEGENILK